MSDTTQTDPTPAKPAAPAPSPSHHISLQAFLQILLALAPAIAAPFIPAGRGEQIFEAEVPIVQAASAALAQN